MARFNSAKMNLAAEVGGITAFERKYNALIDLLDQGYTVESLMNDHNIRVSVNPHDGIKITTDGDNVFSIDPTTGDVVIGKYDDLIDGLDTAIDTAYDDIAIKLGYTDYADMVAAATAGNTIINGGWLRTSLIQANTILFDQLASSTFNTINYLSGNLIQNVTMENAIDRWTGDGTLVNESFDGLTVPVIQLYSNTAHKWAYSEYFRVDPSKAYEVSFWVKKSDAQGNIYIGTNQRSSGGGTQTVTSVNAYTGGVVTTTDSNFYFAYCTTGNSPTDWVRVVGYIMPAGTPADKCKGLGEYGGTMGNSKVAILHADIYEMRVRVGNYNNTSATYVHVANMKVTQVDAQSVIKMVQTGVSYSGVEVTASNGVECTSTIGGKTAIVKLNATDGLAFYDDTTYRGGLEVIGTDLFLTANALKGTESATRYLLWEDAPGVSGSPNLQMYDAGSRVGELSVSEISVGLAGIPQTALDYSEAYLSARSYGANPDNFSNIILYGNKGNSNYAQINVSGDVYDSSQDYSEFLIKNSSLSFFINDVSHFAVSASALTYKTYSIWHSGNDGSGSTLDADTLDGREGWQYARGGVDSYSYATLNTPVNTLTNGFYRCSDGPTGWMHLINLNHQNADGYGAQIRIDYFNGDMYYRSSNALVFDSWHKVWDDGNLTPGDYLARSGGTMTGALTFHTLYSPSTAGVYFDSYGNIWPQSGVTTDANWNIRDNAGNLKFKAWLGKADPIEMSGLTLTGDLTMSSYNLYASALYEGGTAISSKYLSIANVAVGSGTSNATGGADTSVSFGKTFASAPKVCANSIDGAYTCRIKSVSTTGFVLVISGGSVTFNYIAVSA